VKRQTASIKFTQKPKISIFAPQGRLNAPIHVTFDTSEGRVDPSAWLFQSITKSRPRDV